MSHTHTPSRAGGGLSATSGVAHADTGVPWGVNPERGALGLAERSLKSGDIHPRSMCLPFAMWQHGRRRPPYRPALACSVSRGVRFFRGRVQGLQLPALPGGGQLPLKYADGVLGGALWPSAVALCRYLAEHESDWLRRQRPVACELGAGTGAVGLYAAALGARVVLTDVGPLTAAGSGGTARLLRLLEENAQGARSLLGNDAEIDVRELDFAQKSHAAALRASHACDGFDLLLGSDVIYSHAMHAPLANTMGRLLSTEGVALVAHEPRMFEGELSGARDVHLPAFRDKAQAAGLTLEELLQTRVEDGCGTWHTINIVRLRRGRG